VIRSLATLLMAAGLLVGGPAWSAQPRYSPRKTNPSVLDVQVYRIEIAGVEIFETDAIEGALEVRIGEPIDRMRIVRTAQNLQSLYRSKGYEELSVRTELVREKLSDGTVETVLRIQVKEGKPSRLVNVRFSLVGKESPDIWTKVEERVRSRLGFKPGDTYDQERILQSKREILEALADEEYVGARVVEVQEKAATQPAGLQPVPSTARWLDLELKVDIGERVSFGFRGNTQFTLSRLLELVNAQRLSGFGEDYLADIRKRVEDEYRNIGYARVWIETLTFENQTSKEKHVTFVIHEGPRVEIESVEFDGYSSFQPSELRTEFYDRAPNLVQRRYYVPRDVDRAAELLVEWMKSEGFLSARLITVNRTFPNEKRVRLVIYLYEGERTITEAVEFDGLNRMPREDALETLGIAEARPLNLFAFTEGIEKLKTWYRNQGHLDFRVINENTDRVVVYSDENRRARISLELDEGPRFTVSRIEVEGNEKTAKSVILHELAFDVGDTLSEELLNESEANLRRLGIFASANVRTFTDSQKPDSKVVVINVSEGTPGAWEARMGIRNDLGARVLGSVGYGNLWGRNHTLRLDASVNYRIDQYFCQKGPCFPEYQAQLTYNLPHLFLEGLTLRPKLAAEDIRYVTFDANSQSASLTLEKRLFKFPNLVVALDYTIERIKQSNAPNPSDNQELRIGSLNPSIRLDLRDNPLMPTSGFYAQTTFEWASTALGSQTSPPIGYTRFQARMDGHIPFGKGIGWYLSVRAGLARNLEPPPEGFTGSPSEYALPLSKHFVLGGAGSIRGFQDRAINYNDIAIRGTLAYVNYRTQLDLPFSGNLRFGPFLDVGNLYVDPFTPDAPSPFDPATYRWGSGVGFRYLSPVGPVNFDFGFNLFPREGEARSQFYFSIGVI
jgi:outer membrane protein insertion porin family